MMDADPLSQPEPRDYLEPFRVSVHQILNRVNQCLVQLEKQVTEVEQFYESTDNIQGNNSKGGSLVKEKGREKHPTGTKKPMQDASHTEAAAAKRMQELMRQFSTILRQITQHKWAWPFLDPVDVEGLRLHDYYEVIDKPMDFSTIKSKMEAKEGQGYNNVREIYADVRLIFKNAMKYNNEKHDVHVMAKTLLEKFEEKWLQLLPKVAEENLRGAFSTLFLTLESANSQHLPQKFKTCREKRQLEEEAQAQLDIQLAQETTYANKAKDISTELYEVDMQLKSLKEMVIQKCRKLSTQEKKMLGVTLGKLSLENLYRALDVVAETNPIFQPTGDEVDLDLDAQSDYTLWRLKAFVKDALEEQEKVDEGAAVNPNDNPDDKRNKKRRDSGDSSGKTNPKRKKLSAL
ncbi:transcription factor GTE1 isoform X1 [Vigna radiata var. radiata]|uniref:Transcription factor GTE1 isoform X1 n=1 Tax=Vigna radiata var. radiata TaxID=3916 RepID=A0A3Q0F7M2_VIGRR|nr:transcription factor GTE1 isoform X1 [Vigna radiata var. radiata]